MPQDLWPEKEVANAASLIREFRTALGLSQLEFATLAGVDPSALGKSEAGKELRLSGLERILSAFGGELSLKVRLPERPERMNTILWEERDAARGRCPRSGRGYRASFATEWTQSLRKSQRWQKLVSAPNTAASMPEAAARMSAAKVSSPDGS